MLYGFSRTSTPTKQNEKSFISTAEQQNYANGGNKPNTNSFQAYLEASSRLDTIIRTTASVASSAKFDYGRLDAKNNFKRVKFKQADGLYMNDYQTESDFLFELFGTLLTYDKVLLIPEQSQYPYRAGMIDWTIVPDTNFTANVGKSQTIDSFTYKASSGVETQYDYSECIYITRNLTASNLVYAIPRLKSLMNTIENILGIHNFTKEYINSGGKSSVIVSSDALLSEAQAKEVKNTLTSFFDSHKPKALIMNAEKFSLNKVSDSLSTAGVLDIITTLSNEITKSFNMPLYMLGEYSSSTQGQTVVYANRIWFELQVRPLFNTLSTAFTRFFRDKLQIKNSVVKFDFSGIALLEDSDTEKLDLVERSMKSGLLSVNEGRVIMGWDMLNSEYADKHFIQAYLLGTNPITYENFLQDLSRDVANNSVPNGDGGANNDPLLNGAG